MSADEPGSLPVYFINLAARPDRRTFMEVQFDRLGLAATRIDAVTAPEASHPGEGCTKSHIACWRRLLDDPDRPDWALILEDDAILSPSLPVFLREFEASSPDIELIQLETTGRRRQRLLPPTYTFPSGVRLMPYRSAITGTAGYLISAVAARRLLARSDLFNDPTDIMLFRPFWGPGSAIRSAISYPAFIRQLKPGEGRRTNNSVGVSDIAPLPGQPFRQAPLWRRAALSVLNAIDHVAHLPRGLRKQSVPFAE